MVIHGAKGVSWWHPWGTTPAANFAAAQSFVSTINALTGVLTAPPSSRTVTSNSTTAGRRVDAMVKEDSSSVWVFATRLTDFTSCTAVLTPDNASPISTQLTVSSLTNATATVYGEGRTVPMVNGVITDNFDPWATHVYQIPNESGNVAPPSGLQASVQ